MKKEKNFNFREESDRQSGQENIRKWGGRQFNIPLTCKRNAQIMNSVSENKEWRRSTSTVRNFKVKNMKFKKKGAKSPTLIDFCLGPSGIDEASSNPVGQSGILKSPPSF